MKKTNQKKSGFTLIEIMIVIVIIAVLSAIAVPSYMNVKAAAVESAKVQNCVIVQDAIQRYVADSGATSTYVVTMMGDINDYMVGIDTATDLIVAGVAFNPLGLSAWTGTVADWLAVTPKELAVTCYP